MSVDEFKKFIDDHTELLRRVHAAFSHREQVLMQTVKVSEEFGELSDEILGSLGNQRESKLEATDPNAIGDEIADVLITVYILAKELDIDVWAALTHKVEKIKAKHSKELSSSKEKYNIHL